MTGTVEGAKTGSLGPEVILGAIIGSQLTPPFVQQLTIYLSPYSMLYYFSPSALRLRLSFISNTLISVTLVLVALICSCEEIAQGRQEKDRRGCCKNRLRE